MSDDLTLTVIRDRAEYERVRDAGAGDGHRCVEPSHVLRQGEVVLGSVNLGRVTVAHIWLRSDLGGRRLIQASGLLEAVARARGCRQLGVVVGPESPLFVHAEKHFGFVPWVRGTIFAKRLS